MRLPGMQLRYTLARALLLQRSVRDFLAPLVQIQWSEIFAICHSDRALHPRHWEAHLRSPSVRRLQVVAGGGDLWEQSYLFRNNQPVVIQKKLFRNSRSRSGTKKLFQNNNTVRPLLVLFPVPAEGEGTRSTVAQQAKLFKNTQNCYKTFYSI